LALGLKALVARHWVAWALGLKALRPNNKIIKELGILKKFIHGTYKN
jgi:hypothetical protein